jgi:hypothetical protein
MPNECLEVTRRRVSGWCVWLCSAEKASASGKSQFGTTMFEEEKDSGGEDKGGDDRSRG